MFDVLRHLKNAMVDDPELLMDAPETFRRDFRPELVSHSYLDHFVGGPKDHSANPTPGEGVKLLQLDRDKSLGFSFGDGYFEFWISEEALAVGDYEQVEMYLSAT